MSIPSIFFYLSFNLQSLLPFLISIFLFISIHNVYFYSSIFFYLPSNHVNSLLYLLQSLITAIFLNTSLFIQVYPTLIHVYLFLSFDNLEFCLSFWISIFLSTWMFFYLFCNVNNLYPFEFQSLYPSLSPAYLRLSFSILWKSRIMPIFLNLYLLIHMNAFLSLL